jgi:hypothetical protein
MRHAFHQLRIMFSLAAVGGALSAQPVLAQSNPAPAAASKISEEAYKTAEVAFIYGFPMVMNYAVFYDYFIDKTGADYKAPLNQLYNTARVYTPQDTTIVTPNSDTPYSFVGMDLRAEPLVVCNPDIEAARYFSVQLIDMYTFNFGYMGSRTTGNHAACNMIAGPGWKGQKPAGVTQMFISETDFAIALIRTQLFNPADIDNVRTIQAGYRAMTLSQFQSKPAPPAAPEINWPKIDKTMAAADPFAYLNFVLTFCPPIGPAAVEIPMRERFAKIGVEAGKPFPPGAPNPEEKAAFELAAKNGMEAIKANIAGFGVEENGWRVTTNAFGDRTAFAGDFARRAGAAAAGIYGNDAVEALYPLLATDSEGEKPDTSTNRYTLTFPAGGLPPVNAFWSVTMYDGKTQLLIENPLNRYLINSPMAPDLKKNADGSLTIIIQKDSPGKDLEANWLPAPDGPIYVVMRLYRPKETALNETWKPPALVRKT